MAVVGKSWYCWLHAHLGGLLLSAIVYQFLVFYVKALVIACFEEMKIYLLVREWSQQGWPRSSDHGQIQDGQAHGVCSASDRYNQQAVLGSPHYPSPHGAAYLQQRHGSCSWSYPLSSSCSKPVSPPLKAGYRCLAEVASEATILSHLYR